ncbi:NAD(P)H-dependent flavin oxidoreductase [Oceanospirillum maris]|uniref:NAD(P)H-dependent flavin oxidoreductase n=1 Tax=Oceanospirillum maris TaxID=64977 RepID=UPI0003FD708C|nr:nitronate monooxygenase [Oceanospirillum maris]
MTTLSNQCALGDALGIQLAFPVLQAPMAGSQGSALAIAISDAGGLGALPCAMLSIEVLEAELELIRAKPDRLINVNFFCHQPPIAESKVIEAWHQRLSGYFDAFNLDAAQLPSGANRQPFSAEYLAAIAPFQPEIVSFHFGLPEASLLKPIKAWGGKILSTATTLEEGLWLQNQGVDLVIAQGLEAGGHRGHFLTDDLNLHRTTRDLVKVLVENLEVPVIAAGGIATSHDVDELLSLGALGVQVGTAFLLSPEAKTSALHRAALKSELNQNTAVTNLFSGRPARGMRNRFMLEQGDLVADVPSFPLASTAVTALRTAAESQGLHDFSPLWAGTRAAYCEERPAAEILQGLVKRD